MIRTPMNPWVYWGGIALNVVAVLLNVCLYVDQDSAISLFGLLNVGCIIFYLVAFKPTFSQRN